jgi:NAD(P)-dependent dehydrogenase (short-subunit alcohol dehydrogenase family)
VFHSIVNVTSSNAVAVAVHRTEYCASKAAAAMASKALAVRLGPENIAVYDVQPGLIATDMTASVIETYRKRAEEGLTLLPRVGEPQEMGTIIATLASGRLPYTTGQVISADAGMLVSRF